MECQIIIEYLSDDAKFVLFYNIHFGAKYFLYSACATTDLISQQNLRKSLDGNFGSLCSWLQRVRLKIFLMIS